jgi:TPR repeat protein
VDEQCAFYWIEKSANGNNDVAQNTLGHLYEDGIGCQQNYKLAAHWYERSSSQGNAWYL